MRRALPLLLCGALLAGCFGAPPPLPRDHYYRILVPRPAGDGPGPRLAGTVSVPPLGADGLLRERPLLFSAGGRAHEMQQHDYHHWTDPPTRMLQAQLVSYLRLGGLADSVITPNLPVRPDFEVIGRIKRFERLLGDGPPRVHAELELAVVRLADNRMLVFDTYAVERSSGGGVAASIVALNQAVAEIFGRFLADARRTALALRPDPE
jgi:ABC-type uncharacterized transport system auxiliary subunit